LVYALTVAVGVITALGGVIWAMLRNETAKQAEQLEKKVDTDRLREVAASLTIEINDVRDNSEKLVNKLEQRHDKELEQMAHRVGEQIRATEQNILTQIRLMIEVLKSDRT
jgi:DNA anti-recombination protein RmuC